jgi:hypothetical protein
VRTDVKDVLTRADPSTVTSDRADDPCHSLSGKLLLSVQFAYRMWVSAVPTCLAVSNTIRFAGAVIYDACVS